jgi:hypothetical protein
VGVEDETAFEGHEVVLFGLEVKEVEVFGGTTRFELSEH